MASQQVAAFKHPVDGVGDWKINISAQDPEILGYRVETSDVGAVYGTMILIYLEVLGEL